MMKGKKILSITLPIVALSMAIYQLLYTQVLLQDPIAHRVAHLGFAWAVIFLSLMAERQKWIPGLIFLIASVLSSLYLLIFLDEILTYRSALPLTSDLIVGVLVLVLAFTASYLLFGKTFPALAAFFLVYLYFGRYLPYPFTVAPVSIKRILVWLTTPGTEEGIFGGTLALSANYLFLFVFFGSALSAFGGLRFIAGVSQWVGARITGGPAMASLVGSSLLGTLTGSTVANITITGAFTIPLMKEAGYKPQQAGAIEAVSSNGGQIMPPVMGAAAFVMAGFAGIPYSNIMMAAILPALLYYYGVFIYIQILARKIGIRRQATTVRGKDLLYDAPIFFLPLGVLAYLLVRGFSLPFVGFWSIVTLVGVGLISTLRKGFSLTLKDVVLELTKGVKTASEMAVICGLIGVVGTCIEVSGLGVKLPLVIHDISGGSLIIALVIATVASILLGTGVPTVASYLLVATGAVPALLAMGVPLLSAHFFCFLAATFSHITPPVALGALVAARLARADFWETCWESLKAGAVAFLLPFSIIYYPTLLLKPQADLLTSALQMLAMLLGILALQIVLSNYCFSFLKLDERIAFLLSSFCCLSFAFGTSHYFFVAGISLLLMSIFRQFMRRRYHLLRSPL
jgi:TRAP transporter 4TM/12TM fusion protein